MGKRSKEGDPFKKQLANQFRKSRQGTGAKQQYYRAMAEKSPDAPPPPRSPRGTHRTPQHVELRQAVHASSAYSAALAADVIRNLRVGQELKPAAPHLIDLLAGRPCVVLDTNILFEASGKVPNPSAAAVIELARQGLITLCGTSGVFNELAIVQQRELGIRTGIEVNHEPLDMSLVGEMTRLMVNVDQGRMVVVPRVIGDAGDTFLLEALGRIPTSASVRALVSMDQDVLQYRPDIEGVGKIFHPYGFLRSLTLGLLGEDTSPD